MAGVRGVVGGRPAVMWTAEQELNRMYGERIKQRFEILGPLLNEKERRWLAGVEAIAYGRGGITNVARLTGMSAAL